MYHHYLCCYSNILQIYVLLVIDEQVDDVQCGLAVGEISLFVVVSAANIIHQRIPTSPALSLKYRYKKDIVAYSQLILLHSCCVFLLQVHISPTKMLPNGL